jgi:hypothetical protein
VTDNAKRAPEAWRNHSVKHPIAATRLQRGDLRRLYRLINDQQIEYRDKLMHALVEQPNEGTEQFEVRRKRVYDSFVTSMTIANADNELLHGNNETFLEDENLPDNIRSILFSTTTVPHAVLGVDPPCSIKLYLDFTTPPLLDFQRLPALPTPNESSYEVIADNHSWFAASKTKLEGFFKERKAAHDRLHRGAIYDILLFFIGLPLAIWIDYRLSRIISPTMPSILSAAVYVYAFLFSVQVFRVLFSYARWVFPKVELDNQRGAPPLRHRVVWLAIMGSLAAALLYDIAKVVLTN